MDFFLDPASTSPLYVQIEQHLRRLLRDKIYAESDKLPNEIELAERYGVARSTIRQAINQLVMDGMLLRKKAAGTFVVDRPISSNARNWLSFSQEMKLMGVKVRNYEFYIAWVKAPAHIAHFFNIEEGYKILKLERVRGSEESAFVHFISYFNPSIGLHEEDDFTIPLYKLLDEKYHCTVKTSKEEIRATLADEDLSSKLDIDLGGAILQRERKVYDVNGAPVEWNIGYYRADSFTYTVESERN